MCKIIFIGFFCIVFHCNTYKLCAPFPIQIIIHIGWGCLFYPEIIIYHLSWFYSFTLGWFLLDLMDDTWPMIISCMVLLPEEATSDNSITIQTVVHCQSIYSHTQYMWPDLRKAGFHAHNSKTHFSPSNVSCTRWLTIQPGIDAESCPGCFCCGLFLTLVRHPWVYGSPSNGCISPWQADSWL